MEAVAGRTGAGWLSGRCSAAARPLASLPDLQLKFAPLGGALMWRDPVISGGQRLVELLGGLHEVSPHIVQAAIRWNDDDRH